MALTLPHCFVEVDRDRFRIKLYRRPTFGNRYKVIKKYDCAVGAVGFETERGLYYVEVQSRVKFPSWTMPNSSWVAPELRGTVVPGGHPDNPIKARWIGIADGEGFHGTADEASIGHAASHGCIRMRVPDVIELYDYVRAGDMVYIA